MANTTPVRGREGDESLDLVGVAAMIDENVVRYVPPETRAVQQVLCLAEEVGDFVAAYRRARGLARRSGRSEEVDAELADVVITAYVTAHVLGIDVRDAIEDKVAVMFTRGWRDGGDWPGVSPVGSTDDGYTSE